MISNPTGRAEKPVSDPRQITPEVEPILAQPCIIDSPMVDALALRAPDRVTKTRQNEILIWALGYGGTGWNFIALALQRRSLMFALFGAFLVAAGARIGCNAFPPEQRHG